MRSIVVVVALSVVLQLSHGTAQAMSWQSGKGVSCKASCAKSGGGVDSGIFNGDPDKVFYVCSADAGQGARPGYNLNATGANRCVVGYGGREVPVGKYDCLCKN